jgi:hypothetical protein
LCIVFLRKDWRISWVVHCFSSVRCFSSFFVVPHH